MIEEKNSKGIVAFSVLSLAFAGISWLVGAFGILAVVSIFFSVKVLKNRENTHKSWVILAGVGLILSILFLIFVIVSIIYVQGEIDSYNTLFLKGFIS